MDLKHLDPFGPHLLVTSNNTSESVAPIIVIVQEGSEVDAVTKIENLKLQRRGAVYEALRLRVTAAVRHLLHSSDTVE